MYVLINHVNNIVFFAKHANKNKLCIFQTMLIIYISMKRLSSLIMQRELYLNLIKVLLIVKTML